MIDKLVVATENQDGLNALIAEHFGRAPYFTIIDLDSDKKWEVVNVKAIENTSEHRGGVGSPHEPITKLHPKALIVQGMGPRGIMAFQSAGIEVLKANAGTVKEVVEAYKQGRLTELTEGCAEAHHH
jgi:predicted Fe-Mo cluster-binding NifX family protein